MDFISSLFLKKATRCFVAWVYLVSVGIGPGPLPRFYYVDGLKGTYHINLEK